MTDQVYRVEHLCVFIEQDFAPSADSRVEAWVPQDQLATGAYPEAALSAWHTEHGHERTGRFRLLAETAYDRIHEFTITTRTEFDVVAVDREEIAA